MSAQPALKEDFTEFVIERDRDQFLRELLRELAGTLEDVVGLDDASGFISTVGGRIGDMMNQEYRELTKSDRLTKGQIGAALVDLKRRIEGGFKVVSISEDEIVLTNTQCPFGAYVANRTSLCMMTSNVFGRIAAENTGYAEVSIPATIAKGDDHCRVVVSFKPTSAAGDLEDTREYYSSR